MTVSHDYGEKQVLLDVHRVLSGRANPRRGRPADCLGLNVRADDYKVPEANAEIMVRVKSVLASV